MKTLQPESSELMAQSASASDAVEDRPQANASITRWFTETPAEFDVAAELQRRRPAVIFMAAIAVTALLVRRMSYDSLPLLAIETGVVLLAVFLTHRLAPVPSDTSAQQNGTSRAIAIALLGSVCLFWPWAFDVVARRMGYGNDFEIMTLTNLSWGCLAMAATASSLRVLSLSVVASGFLALFSTFIAEDGRAVIFTYVWIAVCLWWLLSNHWATVECLSATQVDRGPATRWSYLLLTVGLFLVTTVTIRDRIPILRKLEAELMPTSGGTSTKDPAARSGVGDGDALIAAKNHASSFGPVETDLFLDSEKPSLFDVFSDEFGEPKKKNRVERAQALDPNEIESNGGKFSEANRASGGSEFSIERKQPKQRPELEDLFAESLMYWEGATGIRLAATRFSRFDGEKWTNGEIDPTDRSRRLRLRSITLDDRTWFRQSSKTVQNSISPFVESRPEALRFTRFRSAEIPTRAGVQMWSIDKITIPEFFAYSVDDCLSMPDRLHVPDYTVVRFVDSRIDRERIEGLLRNCAPGRFHKPEAECIGEIEALAHRYSGDSERGLEQVESVIDGLRADFECSPTTPFSKRKPLSHFLENRRGPSYLFATTAALMLDHLGYETRLVAGFYVSPDHYDASERATAILPQDAHTWLEVNVGHGYWLPLEPTPGYAKPKMRAGILYLARKNWQSIAIACAIFTVGSTLFYVLRAPIFSVLCWSCLPLLALFNRRQKLASLSWMLDIRWLLIGDARSASVTQTSKLRDEQWSLGPSQQQTIFEFLATVDAMRFGKSSTSSAGQELNWRSVMRLILSLRPVRES